jgi:hypothetical protein
MSTPSQEQAFYDAVNTAEAVRQQSKASAFVTYGFVQSKYAAYVTALVAADVAFMSSVITAATAGGLDPQLGTAGPLGAKWCKIGGYS